MRYYEFKQIDEASVSRLKSTNELLKWINQISSYIESFGNNYILYRQYLDNNNAQRPLMKINNAQRTPADVSSGMNNWQHLVLEKLNVKNPVFCRLVPPDSVVSKTDKHMGLRHTGNNFIVIPPKNPRVLWSPMIYDLGAFYVNAVKPTLGHQYNMSPERIDDFINTYEESWPEYPSSFTENEMILDAKYYYLFNLTALLNTVGQQMSGYELNFNQESYLEQFRTYSDIATFLSENLSNLTKNSKQSISKGVQTDKESKKIQARNINYLNKEIANLIKQNNQISLFDIEQYLKNSGASEKEVIQSMKFAKNYLERET